MTKTTFVNGSVVTADFLNAINNPVFASPADNDGEIPLITDADMSSVAGNVKPEWQTFRDTLKLTAGAGLSVSHTGGAIELPNGDTLTVAPGSIVVSNNATNYLFINSAGAVATSTTKPLIGIRLGVVVTSGGAITSITLQRHFWRVAPRGDALKIFGGTGSEGDLTINTTVSWARGEYYYNNLIIDTSGVVNVDKFVRLVVSGNLTIRGSINISTATDGGTGGLTPVSQSLFIRGSGFGGAGSNVPSPTYNYVLSPVGSGGASGIARPAATNSAGGAGGGGILIECGGIVTIDGGTITANGSNAVVGTTDAPGGGGGSGGGIIIKALGGIITINATLNARGGNGANAAGNCGGGGGGGGGTIVCQAPSISNTNLTTNLQGGTGGTSAATVSTSGSAGGSFGGQGGAGSSTNSVAGSSGSTGSFLTLTSLPST